MRKFSAAISAGLLAAATMLLGAGHAQAANVGPMRTSQVLTCTVGDGYTFKYVVHYTPTVYRTLSINDVTVLDAAHGHRLHYIGASIYIDGDEQESHAVGFSMGDGVLSARLNIDRLYYGATKAHPEVLYVRFVGFTNAGTDTPLCSAHPAFWT